MNARLQDYISEKNKAISAKKLKFRKILNICFILAVLAAGYFIVRNFNHENIISIREQLNYFYLIVAFSGISITVLLRGVRWFLLLKPIKQDISLFNIIEIYSGSQVLNYAAPGKWAVPARAFFLKKLESIAITQSIPSLLSELFLDILGMFGFLLSIAVIGGYFRQLLGIFQQRLLNILIGFFILVSISGVVFYFLKGKNRLLDNLFSAINVSFKQRKYFLMACGLTIVILLISFLCDLLTLRALGLAVPYHFVIMAFSFSTIMGFLSPLPGGIGVNEISNAYMFKIFYNAGELALIGTFIRRSLGYLVIITFFGCMKAVHRGK